METALKTGLGIALVVAAATAGQAVLAQRGQPARPRAITQSLTAPPGFPQSRVDESLIEYPLPKGAEAYASIDGKKIHKYVVEQAEISRRFRDAGHQKWWGRITGFSGDTESQQWLMAAYKRIGLTDVHLQPFDLIPQWSPKDFDATITGGGQTVHLTSMQPAYNANPMADTEMDAVYGGLGTEADFAGKDVKGKAVFVYSMQGLPNLGGVGRAQSKGAAIVFDVTMLPGNMHYQPYPSGNTGPMFSLGNDDGAAARRLIEGGGAKVRVHLDVERVPNLKTALVFGTLPGATDETIYLIAHRDGWFDASADNASGVATMLGLAEYFSKVPRAQRKRTIVFVGLDGHHNNPGGGMGRAWMVANKATLFPKTALLINLEHTAQITTQARPRYYPGDELVWGTSFMPLEFYAGGPSRPELEKLVKNTFKQFYVPTEFDASYGVPAGDGGVFQNFVPTIGAGEYHNFFHTDWETPETVPWTSLQAVTRAYAKIIDEVNKIPLSALQRPEEVSPGRGAPPPPPPSSRQP